jgi:hypothetical protein
MLPALAAALALLVMLLAAMLVPLSVLARQNVASNVGQAVAYLAIGATGVVVAGRQPRNPIGWLLLAVAVGMLLNKDSQCYAWLAYGSGQRLPFGSAALLLNFSWIVLLVAFPLVILLFPDGRLPSPAWRWAMWAYLAVVASLPPSVTSSRQASSARTTYALTPQAAWPRSTIRPAGRLGCPPSSRW